MPEQTVASGSDPRSRVEAAIGQTLATFDDAYAAIGSIASATKRSRVRDALGVGQRGAHQGATSGGGEGRDDEVADDLAGRVRRLEVEVSVHSAALEGLMRAVHIEGRQS